MEKAKYNEIPKEYRKNYKKEVMEGFAKAMFTFCVVTIMMWMFITFR